MKKLTASTTNTILCICLTSAVIVASGFYFLTHHTVEADEADSPAGGPTVTIVEPGKSDVYVLSEGNFKSKFSQADLLTFTNDYRATKGLAPLELNEQLNASACAKAEDMKARNYWSHDTPEGNEPWYFIEQTGLTYRDVGENIAYGQNSGRGVVDQWIKSPTHEANLSRPYTIIGVCSVFAKDFQAKTNQVITVAHYAN